MANFTSNTYQIKRKILTFTNKILNCVKVQITAFKKDIYLVLVYGISEHSMMLATNKEIKSKEDVISVARIYFSCWEIAVFGKPRKREDNMVICILV